MSVISLVVLVCSGCRAVAVRERPPSWYSASRATLEDGDIWVSIGSGASLDEAREGALAELAQRFEAQVRVRELTSLRGGIDGQTSELVRDVRVDSDVIIRGARVADVWRSSGGRRVALLMELDLGVMSEEIRRLLDHHVGVARELVDVEPDDDLSPLERVRRFVRAQLEMTRAWERAQMLGALGREVEFGSMRTLDASIVRGQEEARDALRVQVRVRDGQQTGASEAFERIASERFRTALPTDRVHALLTFESSVRPMDIEAHPSGVWSSIVRWRVRVSMVDVITGAQAGEWVREGVAFGSSEVEVRRDARAQMERAVRMELNASIVGMLGSEGVVSAR
ncbi:MAG: hypothetical protein ACYTF7_05070 [Planctomycetota bacterium]